MASERTAEQVFQLLADEIRLDVLRAVADAQHDGRGSPQATLSFSEIYDRVAVENTSKLSYHLGELTGTFLRKTEEGYGFTHAGERMVRFVLAENYRNPAEFGPIEAEGRCLRCGADALRAAAHEQYVTIQCAACEQPVFTYRLTPAQVRAHSGEELIAAVVWDMAGDLVKMRQGVCPECTGRMDTEVVDVDDRGDAEGVPVQFATMTECRQCRRFLSLPVSIAAAYHPESIAFHWEHGVDVVGTGVWEFHQYLRDGRWTTERTDADPERYEVTLRQDDASLRLLLDDGASVTRTERVRSSDHADRR